MLVRWLKAFGILDGMVTIAHEQVGRLARRGM
jgi:hypothetical protein